MGSVPGSTACQLRDLGQTISPLHALDSPSENGDIHRVSCEHKGRWCLEGTWHTGEAPRKGVSASHSGEVTGLGSHDI